MSEGWQWAYRQLKDGVRTVAQFEAAMDACWYPAEFKRDARRGLADYLEELEDEAAIAKGEQDEAE